MSISKHPTAINAELKQCNGDRTQQLQGELELSLFFTKLPTEIRLLIYENLFGWRTVHIFRRYFWLDQRMRLSKWRHKLCCRDPQRDFMQHMVCCSDTLSYPQLDTSILFTCRQA